MSSINCPQCNGLIRDSWDACPQCGMKLSSSNIQLDTDETMNKTETLPPVKDEVDLKPITKPSRWKIIIAIGVVFAVLALTYVAYQNYQYFAFIDRSQAIFNKSFALLTDQTNNSRGGKRYLDHIDEEKRIRLALQDLRLKLVENSPSTPKAKTVYDELNKAIENQILLADYSEQYLRADLNMEVENDSMDRMASRYSSYIEDLYDESKQKRDKWAKESTKLHLKKLDYADNVAASYKKLLGYYKANQ